MASAAPYIPSAQRVDVKSRIFQGEGSTTRVGLNSAKGTLLAIEGEELVFPIGCRELEIQPRLCGDHYAEIQGAKFYVAGFGPRPLDAVKHALSKVNA